MESHTFANARLVLLGELASIKNILPKIIKIWLLLATQKPEKLFKY